MKYKKLVLIGALVIILYPISSRANIMCNDGTYSPTCGDCHRGCCSHHGGCASNYSSYQSESRYETSYESIDDEPIIESTYDEIDEDIENDNDDSSSGIAELGLLGGIAAFIYSISKIKR